jgi:hypothetical protein
MKRYLFKNNLTVCQKKKYLLGKLNDHVDLKVGGHNNARTGEYL